VNQVSYEQDAAKIARLGFQPQHNLEEGVRDIVEKFRGLVKKRDHPVTVKAR